MPAPQSRSLYLTVAGTPYEVIVRPCPMSALVAGGHIVGPDSATLLEVWTSCGEHEHGWLEVRNLSMTDAQAAALLAEPGAVESGCDPRDGFFSYPSDTLMDRVVSQRPL
jgi:hypothetical protein